MTTEPRNLTLERVNRLTQAVADLMESHAAQGQAILRILDAHGDQLARIEAHLGVLTKEVRALTSEQALLGNRVENAFSRALRANIRLDDMEDALPPRTPPADAL